MVGVVTLTLCWGLPSLPEPLCDVQLSLSVIGSRILDRSYLPACQSLKHQLLKWHRWLKYQPLSHAELLRVNEYLFWNCKIFSFNLLHSEQNPTATCLWSGCVLRLQDLFGYWLAADTCSNNQGTPVTIEFAMQGKEQRYLSVHNNYSKPHNRSLNLSFSSKMYVLHWEGRVHLAGYGSTASVPPRAACALNYREEWGGGRPCSRIFWSWESPLERPHNEPVLIV